MPVVIPNVFVPGTVADAIQVNQDFNALKAKFDGAITDDDISSTANIVGTKLAPASTPGGRIIPNSITSTQLSTAPPAVVTANLTPGCVTRAIVSTAANQTLIKSNLDIIATPITVTNLGQAGTFAVATWSIMSLMPYFTNVAGFWNYSLHSPWINTSAGTTTAISAPQATVISATTRTIIGWHATSNYVAGVVAAGPVYGIVSWTFTITHIEN